MKLNVPTLVFAATAAGILIAPSAAQTPAQPPLVSILGQVESIDAASKSLRVKAEDGGSFAVTLAEKGTVVKVAPGEKSLQNAAPIAFDAITVGDRVLVRGGTRSEGKLDGALRVVVMAKTDLAARNEEEQKAWRERGISGTVVSIDTAKTEFGIQLSGAAASTQNAEPSSASAAKPTVTVDASKATLSRYADNSVKFDDAKPSTVAEVAAGDQVRLLGKRSEDGARIAADKIVFGSFKTMALAIEKVDPGSGVLSVKDLETNKKFSVSLVSGGTIKKIPAEMAQMFAMMGGAGRAGAGGASGAGQSPAGAAPPRPQGGGAMTGGAPGSGGFGGGQGRPGGGGRRMEDLVDRLPVITLADLKKDDWIGAVVGKVDAQGKAVAFNVLAGIEVFASRANRGGGVDVGMPAGLLDGAFGVP